MHAANNRHKVYTHPFFYDPRCNRKVRLQATHVGRNECTEYYCEYGEIIHFKHFDYLDHFDHFGAFVLEGSALQP